MAFERFVKRGNIKAPMASIWARGQIGLNVTAIAYYALHVFRYAILFFDDEQKKIGIRFTNDDAQEGIRQLVHGVFASTISAKSFVDFYHIPCGRFMLRYDEELDLYLCD